MRKQECFDYSRRALLGASGALALPALLQPLRIFAQAGGGKLRVCANSVLPELVGPIRRMFDLASSTSLKFRKELRNCLEHGRFLLR